jgi:hypothetical protein
MMASMVTAYIQAIEPPVLPPVSFQFNPAQIQIKFDGMWGQWRQSSTGGPQPTWQGIKPDQISVPLTLDMFSLPKPGFLINMTIDTLRAMCLPTEISKAMGRPMPPIVMFGWGPNIILPRAIVNGVTITYKRFLLGVPIRADVQVSLGAVPLPAPLGAMNPTSGGLAPERTHTVTAGDTLPSIAFAAYGNPNRWRAIAEVNNIDDPMRLRIGHVLRVPDKHAASALS